MEADANGAFGDLRGVVATQNFTDAKLEEDIFSLPGEQGYPIYFPSMRM